MAGARKLSGGAVRAGIVVASASLCACAHDPPRAEEDTNGAPSALDFHWAMEAAVPGEVDGRPVLLGHCSRVEDLQCAPLGGGRYRCTYRFPGGEPRTAVIERREGSFWHWVSGSRRCSIILM